MLDTSAETPPKFLTISYQQFKNFYLARPMAEEVDAWAFDNNVDHTTVLGPDDNNKFAIVFATDYEATIFRLRWM